MNMKIIYIADFFYPEMNGGGEQNDHELLEILKDRGHSVLKVKSDQVTNEIISDNDNFIVSNFIFMFNKFKDALGSKRYMIYEHDHKYLRTRDPALYEDYLAPPHELVNIDFYRNARSVFVQSKFHEEIIFKNLNIRNIHNVGGNLWPEETLNKIAILSENEKQDCYSIMVSNIKHKNTKGAIEYCQHHRLNYELIQPCNHLEFLEKLSKNKGLVFLPKTPETLSRIVVEARMLGCEVRTINRKVGATSEEWFSFKNKELIDVFRKKRDDITTAVEEVFNILI